MAKHKLFWCDCSECCTCQLHNQMRLPVTPRPPAPHGDSNCQCVEHKKRRGE